MPVEGPRDVDVGGENTDDDETEKVIKGMCLPAGEFLHLLQGEGVRDKKPKQLLIKYPSSSPQSVTSVSLKTSFLNSTQSFDPRLRLCH